MACACPHPNQGRYIMISSQLPRAKPSTLRAGHPPATAPRTRLPVPTHTAAVFSAFFHVLSPCLARPSPRYRPSQSFSSPISTPIDTAKDAMRRDGGPPHSFVNLLRPLLRKENCEWT